MSEMVERVAQAIMDCDADILEIVAVRAARAAIDAMREPTAPMVQAALNTAAGTRHSPEIVFAAWPAMIDAAIAGERHASAQAEDEGSQKGGR